ncbi:uncharacterized protein G2W53_027342 [Senna tora]|uniref:Uncharacterized protein n=1 Tax=Senna tora TaxID=362788 RepID=A0A834WGJ5_9FABA|nr:uncharacterized protein G2W53_027342 [Senna tora]
MKEEAHGMKHKLQYTDRVSTDESSMQIRFKRFKKGYRDLRSKAILNFQLKMGVWEASLLRPPRGE